jgi:streptomycin 6-kinase
MRIIPENFARTVVELDGDEGVAWLQRLPSLIDACERRWSITVGPPYLPLTYNYVAPSVRADGTPVVLKLGFPSSELDSEVAALRLYDGHGAAQLLEVDLDQNVFLIERLEPGTRLRTLPNGEQATTIAAGVMRQLWQAPVDDALVPLGEWTSGLSRLRPTFNGTTGPFPARLVEQAEALFAELLGSMGRPVVLHGDLHHDNILAARRQPWLAIDPKGLVGEAEYETATWILNTVPENASPAETRRIVARCIDQLAGELGFDPARIHAWTLAHSVLSAWWMVEDHGHGWEPALATAEIVASLKV